jgi:hypothetical protein
VPTLITAMQNDSLVTQNRNAYNAIPTSVEKAYVELAGAGHNQIGQPTTAIARNWIPWLKLFVDDDARYHQFLCPTTDMSGLSQYQSSCPLISTTPPTSGPTVGPTTTSPTGPPPSSPPVGGACAATYRTVNSWSGGFQGEMTVQPARLPSTAGPFAGTLPTARRSTRSGTARSPRADRRQRHATSRGTAPSTPTRRRRSASSAPAAPGAASVNCTSP